MGESVDSDLDVLSGLYSAIFEALDTIMPGATTLNEMRVVHYLYHAVRQQKRCSVTALSRDLRLNKTTVSHIITRLIDRGAVVEQIYEEDRRCRVLRLAGAAQAAVEKSMAQTGEFLRSV